MSEITILDHDTIDKIAAGEVVERPASVVKELIENAIDSGAKAITVEIKEGGCNFIRVTDNGEGIKKTQIKKAFLRHATSKIKSIEDLNIVKSLGFRGEALSSVAAVSKVELITKTKEELAGIRYVLEGGTEVEFQEVGAPNGTTILIRNLFFNTPARRKFLKSFAVEGGVVSDIMEHMALSKPDISFQFIMNNHTKFHTSGNGNLGEIIYRIYGREIANRVIPIYQEQEGMILQGFIGNPTCTRGNRNYENYFVNNRYCKSAIIAKAIEEGYRFFLMQHNFPFVLLYLTLPPESIDVNVHPAKMDIRFHQENELVTFLSQGIRDTLKQGSGIPAVNIDEKEEPQDIVESEEPFPHRIPEPFEVNRLENIKVTEVSNYRAEIPKVTKMKDIFQKEEHFKVLGSAFAENKHENDKNTANIIKANEHIFVEKPIQRSFLEPSQSTNIEIDGYKILGQLFKTYWLFAKENTLFIMDQHAAHEKVKYEALLKQLQEKTLETQMLNPPIIVTFSGKEESTFLQFEEHFQNLGFEIEAFGGNEYAIRCIPTDLYGANAKSFFQEIIDELTGETSFVKNSVKMMEKIASMACKAAVKGNYSMSTQEAQSLLEQLMTLENPYQCPHGRPTVISMSKYEIDRKFKRQ